MSIVFRLKNLFLDGKLDKLYKYIAIFFVATCYIATLFYGGKVLELTKYLLFQIIFIYFQGRFIFRLLKLKFQGASKVAICYGFGIAATIIEYLLFFTINHKSGVLYIGAAFAIIEVGFYYKEFKNSKSIIPIEFTKIPPEIWFIFCVLFFITFFGFVLGNPLPDEIGRMKYNQDLLWSIGNTEALLRQFPPTDPRMVGIPFIYHCFLNVHLAVMSFITKINPTVLFFKYSIGGKLFFLVTATYAFGEKFFNNKNKGVILTWVYFFTNCASMYLAFSRGFGVFLNSNFKHLTDNPFGLELSMALLMTFSIILMDIFREDKIEINNVAASVMLFFALSGTKGPLALMIVLVLFAVYVLKIILRKRDNRILILTVVFSSIFFVIFNLVLSSGSSDLNFKLGYIVSATLIGQKITSLGVGDNIKEILNIAAIPLHYFLYLPFASIPFIVWFVGKVKRIKDTRNIEFFIGGYVIVGCICAYIFQHYGHSEIYFIMAAIPFMELCALDWVFKNHKSLKKIGVAFIIMTFVIASITTVYITVHQFKKGVHNVKYIIKRYNYEKTPYVNAITKYEYEAMKWLEKNTDYEDIIAGDRHYYTEKNTDIASRYFYYSAFSNRQFYLESWFYMYAPKDYKEEIKRRKKINDNIYDNNIDDYEILKEENIEYVVVSSYINADLELTKNYLEKVFENRDVKIYKVEN
ncbi:hypothetical protein [Oceanirhabdus sp. W0125-5]|uniref:hypothetical protein n=1 Tax=Oceanirhabdus sp. W0125-5 TaxID=2999116 RepID=UPI0022F32EEC|nr:hypothetical protein [Oceanirhabdus sp. W0125-5]WBW99441.1 hypothetical protein OW730_12050 [Oceanirhabdus sp. W0125-5]